MFFSEINEITCYDSRFFSGSFSHFHRYSSPTAFHPVPAKHPAIRPPRLSLFNSLCPPPPRSSWTLFPPAHHRPIKSASAKQTKPCFSLSWNEVREGTSWYQYYSVCQERLVDIHPPLVFDQALHFQHLSWQYVSLLVNPFVLTLPHRLALALSSSPHNTLREQPQAYEASLRLHGDRPQQPDTIRTVPSESA